MKKKALLTFIVLLCITGSMLAQATLSVQGTVKNSDGTAVSNGKYSFKFSLYTTESGGTPVWTETQDAIQVSGGVYSALLGASNPLNAAFDRVYYLGVGIDGGAEWIPRAKLSSSPYALSLVGTSNVFPSSGAIGAGTTSPDPNTQLTVSGGTGDGKMLLTAPGDKAAYFWIRSGDKLGGITQFGDGNMSIGSPGGMNLTAARVHLYEGGSLKAYTDPQGFIVSGRMYASGDLSGGGNLYMTGSGEFGGRIVVGNGDVTTPTNVDLKLYRAGDAHIVCRGDGWTEFKKGLYIPNGNSIFLSSVNRVDNAGWATSGGGFKYDVDRTYDNIGILSDKMIAATGYFIKSDARVKKVLTLSNGVRDLATLLGLEVTDYRQVDTITFGNK
ncbi:MAG: hypothetical protein ACKOAY_12675, partial [Haliscomenobacter sp.]